MEKLGVIRDGHTPVREEDSQPSDSDSREAKLSSYIERSVVEAATKAKKTKPAN